jgi:dCMP deaminase
VNKWDHRFFELALTVAQWSKDPSTKVGSVIVGMGRTITGIGYNGFPRGVSDDEDRYTNKENKYRMIVHAEANAILNANGPVRYQTMYTTKFPCTECTKLIIQSRIDTVVCPRLVENDSKWAVDARYSRIMLKEANLTVTEFDV